MSLIHYGETMEEEGTFGEQAKGAWENAQQEWNRFATRDLSTAYNYSVQLRDLESVRKEMADLQQQLETLLPGQMEKIHQAKLAKLSDDERKALEKRPAERTPDESNLAGTADYKSKATWEEVADQAPEAVRPKARLLADEIAALKQKASTIDTFRDIVNYNYWLARVETEPTDDCLAARDTLYDAGVKYEEGDLEKSQPEVRRIVCHLAEGLGQMPCAARQPDHGRRVERRNRQVQKTTGPNRREASRPLCTARHARFARGQTPQRRGARTAQTIRRHARRYAERNRTKSTRSVAEKTEFQPLNSTSNFELRDFIRTSIFELRASLKVRESPPFSSPSSHPPHTAGLPFPGRCPLIRRRASGRHATEVPNSRAGCRCRLRGKTVAPGSNRG